MNFTVNNLPQTHSRKQDTYHRKCSAAGRNQAGASITQAPQGGSTFWHISYIIFKNRLRHQIIFSANLRSRARVDYLHSGSLAYTIKNARRKG